MLDQEFLNLETNELPPLACDFETTGLKKSPNNALSLSLVVADRSLPILERPALNILFLHKPEDVQDVAVAMNQKLFVARALANKVKPEQMVELCGQEVVDQAQEILSHYEVCKDWEEATVLIDQFLNDNYGEDVPKLLGKNVKSFDKGFFPQDIQDNYFQEDVVDVGDLWKKEGDKRNPATPECCRRAGISDKVTHDAYDDNVQAMTLWEIALDKRSPANP